MYDYMEKKLFLRDSIVILRKATREDKDAVISHYQRCSRETNFLMSKENEFNIAIPDDSQDSKAFVIVAVVGTRIIGSCLVFPFTRARMRHIRGIAMAIEKDYWGLGLGKLMIKDMLTWADHYHINRLTLEVDADNYKAISLYHKHGFDIEGRLRNSKQLEEGEYKDSYIMSRISNRTN